MSDAGNLSQRTNRRFSPNRRSMRPSWGTVRATDVLPIPPTPMRAIGSRRSAKPIIFSINSSRPNRILGGGGGNSPHILNVDARICLSWPKRKVAAGKRWGVKAVRRIRILIEMSGHPVKRIYFVAVAFEVVCCQLVPRENHCLLPCLTLVGDPLNLPGPTGVAYLYIRATNDGREHL